MSLNFKWHTVIRGLLILPNMNQGFLRNSFFALQSCEIQYASTLIISRKALARVHEDCVIQISQLPIWIINLQRFRNVQLQRLVRLGLRNSYIVNFGSNLSQMRISI